MIRKNEDNLRENREFPRKLKIVPELVPSPLWDRSLATIARHDAKAKKIWEKIRKVVFSAANWRCEVCGSKAKVVHEVWEYDDLRNIQKLVGFKALCNMCNLATHLGLASVRGLDKEALEHLCRVNEITVEEVKSLIQDSFEIWRKRNAFDWEQDLSWLIENAQNYQITREDAIYLISKLQELMKKKDSSLLNFFEI